MALQCSSNKSTVGQVARQIYDQRGLAPFYRGCGPSTLRAAMVTSLRMVTYEAVLDVLDYRRHAARSDEGS